MIGRYPRLLVGCAALAGAAALLAAGCGGDGGGNSTSSVPASQTAGLVGPSAVLATASAPSGAPSPAASAPATVASTASAPARNEQSPDACALVTAHEAARALGEPVRPAERTEPARAGRSDCNCSSVGNSGAEVVYVQVDAAPRVRAVYDLALSTYRQARLLTGLGEAAFTLSLDAPVVQVHVLHRDAYVTVAITNMNVAEPQRRETAIALARAAIARI